MINAGEDGSVILNKVKEGDGDYGYNAASGEYGNLIGLGIIDPTKVTRTALQNAASVSGLLLTTEAMVSDAPSDDGWWPADARHGRHGRHGRHDVSRSVANRYKRKPRYPAGLFLWMVLAETAGMPPVDLTVPDCLTATVSAWFAGLSDTAGIDALSDSDPDFLPTLQRVLACSSYVADMLQRKPDTLVALHASGRLARPSSHEEIHGQFAALLDDEPGEADFERELRWARHRELVRIVWRDLGGLASVEETLGELSAVADGAINVAVDWSQRQLAERFGRPCTAEGVPAEFVVFAMGKLGGGELNFSSDVDLVFGFTEHGETDGPSTKSNEEFFRLLGQRVMKVLSKNTADGFVYRVDIRLRPFGDSGPVAVSLPALETYLAQHGRDWERYAWVKARAVNHWSGAQDFFDDVVRPLRLPALPGLRRIQLAAGHEADDRS